MSLLKDWIQIERRRSHRSALIWHGGISFVLIATLIITALVPPSSLPLPPCRFAEITDNPCPFCGYTRALHALATGHWKTALIQCPLAVVLFIALLGVLTWHLTPLITGSRLKPGPKLRLSGRSQLLVAAAATALVLANWLYRLAMGFK